MGEVELEIEAGSRAALFSEALNAFRELVGGVVPDGEPLHHDVSFGPAETALLLVDWLNELVFLAELHGFVPERVARIEVGWNGLRATIDGVRGKPRHVVKAATLHRLRVERDEEVWRAHIVLDV